MKTMNLLNTFCRDILAPLDAATDPTRWPAKDRKLAVKVWGGYLADAQDSYRRILGGEAPAEVLNQLRGILIGHERDVIDDLLAAITK